MQDVQKQKDRREASHLNVLLGDLDGSKVAQSSHALEDNSALKHYKHPKSKEGVVDVCIHAPQ
jgi:hypothetical protein